MQTAEYNRSSLRPHGEIRECDAQSLRRNSRLVLPFVLRPASCKQLLSFMTSRASGGSGQGRRRGAQVQHAELERPLLYNLRRRPRRDAPLVPATRQQRELRLLSRTTRAMKASRKPENAPPAARAARRQSRAARRSRLLAGTTGCPAPPLQSRRRALRVLRVGGKSERLEIAEITELCCRASLARPLSSVSKARNEHAPASRSTSSSSSGTPYDRDMDSCTSFAWSIRSSMSYCICCKSPCHT